MRFCRCCRRFFCSSATGAFPRKSIPSELSWRLIFSCCRSLRAFQPIWSSCWRGTFIIGSFSYYGAYISTTHHYNALQIGMIMTGFGLMSVLGGRVSGKLASHFGPMQVLRSGLLLAAAGDGLVYFLGGRLSGLLLGVAALGLGFILTHSTLVTRATEFARQARGTAMSLVAFCFMGSGGLGTAIGGRIIARHGIGWVLLSYGSGLMLMLGLSFLLFREESPAPAPVAEAAAGELRTECVEVRSGLLE
jgi:predicted MFS family arabinose efflux permease